MPGAATPDDIRWMKRAVELGRRGRGRVHPNPAVGCVVVHDGEVVGEGWHEEFGGPHAEVVALSEAGARAHGATAYVSLEPCRHEGKTPACTAALARAEIARLVFGAPDPSPGAGGGSDELETAGVEVVGPLLPPAAARRENPAFFHRVRAGGPWLQLKLAVSLDARIAARPGERTTLTGTEARHEVHALRASVDAVLVGSGTVQADDPLLTVREDVPMRRAPARLVLDSTLRIDPTAALFRDLERVPLVVFTRDDASELGMETLEEAGATVHPVSGASTGRGLDLDRVLEICRTTGYESILCEGGGRLARALIEGDRVERMTLHVAPVLLGEDGVPAFPGPAPDEAPVWRPVAEPRRLGRDIELVYERARPWSDDPGALAWTPVPGPDSPSLEREND